MSQESSAGDIVSVSSVLTAKASVDLEMTLKAELEIVDPPEEVAKAAISSSVLHEIKCCGKNYH